MATSSYSLGDILKINEGLLLLLFLILCQATRYLNYQNPNNPYSPRRATILWGLLTSELITMIDDWPWLVSNLRYLSLQLTPFAAKPTLMGYQPESLEGEIFMFDFFLGAI